MTIPKILHFCWLSVPNGRAWGLSHFAAVASAVSVLKPDRALLHANRAPGGPWWNHTSKLVTLNILEPPERIFGNPVKHPAHQSDIIRLQQLASMGGIYLDVDIIMHADLEALLSNRTVMSRQRALGPTEGNKTLLSNAAILAEPSSEFINLWLNSYRSFRGDGMEKYWNEHSVHVPGELANQHPELITILPDNAFCLPLYTKEGLIEIFRKPADDSFKGLYGNHLWESHAWDRYLANLTPRDIRRSNSSFSRWVQPYLSEFPDDEGRPSLGARIAWLKRRAQAGTRKLRRVLRSSARN